MEKLKIAVAGTGYVGLSNAVLLSAHNTVVALDIIQEKVDMINSGQSPIIDAELQEYLAAGGLDLKATTDPREAFEGARFVIVSTPTNYDPDKNYFDTSSVEKVIAQVREIEPDAVIVIKSTVPVGYTMTVREQFGSDRIIFSPEFLREGRALYDNLYPSRIIVGAPEQPENIRKMAVEFAQLLSQGAKKENIDILITEPTEAEAVKLFANTYLALRVSYFNELDTYAEMKGLDTQKIIIIM